MNYLAVSREAWKKFFEEHPEMILPAHVKENTQGIAAMLEVEKFYCLSDNAVTDETGEITLTWKPTKEAGLEFRLFKRGLHTVSYLYQRGRLVEKITLRSENGASTVRYEYGDDGFPCFEICSDGGIFEFLCEKGSVMKICQGEPVVKKIRNGKSDKYHKVSKLDSGYRNNHGVCHHH